MKRSAIIVAAGKGLRFGGKLPKPFVMLNEKPVLVHTVNRFLSLTPRPHIVVVVSKESFGIWEDINQQYFSQAKITTVEGGANRYDSVRNGLSALENEGVVAVHDGVRPLVSDELIERVYRKAEEMGSAIPAISPTDSIRIKTNKTTKSIDRESISLVQTPQAFDTQKLKKAYDASFDTSLTDDAGIFEASGNEIHIVEGEDTNIKITTKKDRIIAENFIE